MEAQPPNLIDKPWLIQLEDVAIGSLHEPNKPVLEGVNWSIAQGDFWVVGGLPDSGKSDLLTTVAGLLRPIQGTLRLFGRPTGGLRGDALLQERLRIGLVFADGGRLFPNLSVLANVSLPLRYHCDLSPAEAEPPALALLNQMDLGHLALFSAGRINRSCRQRVALARALILKPEVLLLDNPLAGLDPRQVGWWLDFLGQLSSGHELLDKRPLTLAIATDDLRPWCHRAQLFALIKENRWLIIGRPDSMAAGDDPLFLELMAAPVNT